LDTRDKAGRTPLALAALTNNEKIVAFLLRKGASALAAHDQQSTPLHFAAEVGAEAIVAQLLANKVDVNKQDDTGFTPLIIAAQNGYGGIVKRLLQYGASLELTDNWEKHPARWWAARNNHDDVVKIIDQAPTLSKRE